jgi:hypothetical protein
VVIKYNKNKYNLMENIQEIFFSKNNIITLNNKILEKINNIDLNKNQKIFIANTIVKHMKIIWKSLNLNKINNANIKSIFNQFNSIVLKNSFTEISTHIQNEIKDPYKSKYERDFNSNPNNGVSFMERSESQYNNYLGPNLQSMNESKKIHSIANNFNSNIDSLFRPLIDDPPEEPKFNNYQNKRDSSDYTEKLQDIQKLREIEVPQNKKNQDIPDFLKSKATCVRKQDDLNKNVNFNQVLNKKDNNKQYNNIQDNDDESIIFLDGMNDDENLFSLDNIDKPLITVDIVEDSAPFEDRLKKLKNERENLSLPSQKQVNFASDDFRDNFDEFKDIEPTKINNLKNKSRQYDEEKTTYDDEKIRQYEENLIRQREEEKKKKYEEFRLKKYEEEIKIKQYEEEIRKKIYEEEIRKKIYEELKNQTPKNKNITIEYKEIFDKLKLLNKNLISQNSKLKEENEKLILELQERPYESKKKNYQIEISPENSISNYRFNFMNPIKIIGIKLLNYSIPIKQFNIEENINNIFKYKIEDEIKDITLSTGFYNIEKIIEILNNQSDLIFELDMITQKIKIKSELDFTIIKTNLSTINLGIYNEDTGKEIIADNIYDLRIDNKVYLFLNNITTTPFAILNPNNTIIESETIFENEVVINYLDILFKDSNNNEVNFYNIKHYLNIQVSSLG